jgi:competence protein ComGC
MANQQLLDYIRQQLQQGVNKKQIKNSLISNGWQVQDINEVFSFIENSAIQLQQVPPPMQTISSLPGATTIFGQAWAIYKQRLGTFLGVMVIPILVLITVPAVFAVRGLLAISLLSSKFAAGGIDLLILLAILYFVIIFISQVLGQIALLYAVKDSQERIGVMESYRRGWHKIFSYWWVSLLAGFITLGGFLLLIVPGIIFAVWFSLAVFVLIAEDLKGMNALFKSREYVKGKWGGVFWRFFFIGVISLIISLVPILIFSFLKIPFGEEISRFVIGLFLIPLTMTYAFLVYSNLKALKGEIAFAPTGGKKATFIIIGILGILIIPAILFLNVFLSLGSAREKVRDGKRQSDIRQIQVGLEIYYSENNRYPFSLNELPSKYLPIDPSTNQPYQYQLQLNGTDYKVCTQLESTKTQKCVTSQF